MTCCVHSVNCKIDVESHTFATTADSHIALNGRRVLDASYFKHGGRGVTVATINPVSCTGSGFVTFDTHGNSGAGRDLSNYLSMIPNESIVVGATHDEPARYLSPAIPELETAGVHASDVGFRGTFAFVLQKGYPMKTKYIKSARSAAQMSRLQARIFGM